MSEIEFIVKSGDVMISTLQLLQSEAASFSNPNISGPIQERGPTGRTYIGPRWISLLSVSKSKEIETYATTVCDAARGIKMFTDDPQNG